MTIIPVITSTTASTIAAAEAAKRRRMQRNEEERMTGYSKDDLEGWEFKIVRAATRKFKDSETVRQLCEEEARSGLEMVEKFDDHRIRFKRSTDHRADDRHREIDSYRTQIGMSGSGQEWAVAAGVACVLGLVLLVAFFFFVR